MDQEIQAITDMIDKNFEEIKSQTKNNYKELDEKLEVKFKEIKFQNESSYKELDEMLEA
jgi:hypothetical protein